MHPVIQESLEEYLAGALAPAEQRQIDAHLATCGQCRLELSGMQEISVLVRSLKPAEVVEAPLGFAGRVAAQAAERQIPSFWSMLSLDLAFSRRVAFACLLTLAVLGSYLVSRENQYTSEPSPEAVMALEQTPAPAASGADRDRMLVTLTSYEP
jgi:anti-sigma factor RsiW